MASAIVAIGPGPLRTARGAGRAADFEAGLDREVDLVLLPDDRVRELEPRPLADVLLLRDPGGEDVRVAMLRA